MTADPPTDETFLSLTEVAERRGLHYMTIYRHVRTGRLPAVKENGEWRVRISDLNTDGGSAPRGTPGNANIAGRLDAFSGRLTSGDEPGAWSILESCLGGGADPAEIHHQLIIPVLNQLGDRWERGEIRVVEEHTATAIVSRLVARLGPLMRSKGRTLGTIVVGAVAGDSHALATSIVSDLLRNARYSVIDLGGNTPAQSFLDTVSSIDQRRAVGVSVSEASDERVRETIDIIQSSYPSVPVLVGGRGIRDRGHALSLGSAGWAEDSREIVSAFHEAISGRAHAPATAVHD